MKKGTINIRKTKKGFEAKNVDTSLQLTEFEMHESDHGKEYEYEVSSGRLSELSVEGQNRSKKYNRQSQKGGKIHGPKHHKSSLTGNSEQQGANSAPTETARAPYNFIPLNQSVVEFNHAPSMDKYFCDRHSGHIELNIETLTPFFIRGSSTDPDQECNKNPDFFSPCNSLKIPGSSLRGMLRQLVEIVSSGKFQCDDRQLFFRDIASEFYRETMIDVKNNCFPRVSAGLLVKGGGRYFIRPSKLNQNTQYYRINGQFDGADFKIPGITGGLQQFTFRRIFFKPVSPTNRPHTDSKGNPIQLRYALVTAISETPQKDHCEGYLVISGKFARKKHMQWIINMPGINEDIEIPDEVVKRYKEDNTREAKTDLLEQLKRHSEVPCFYLFDDQNRMITAFGHTGLFRHPYKYSIHQHFNPELKNDQSIDCAEAIFGKLDHWAGRVFFEDANLMSGQLNVMMEKTSPKILSGPKPTTFQHYLESNNGKYQHWGEKNAKLRGYKLYWHRDTQKQDEYHWSEKRQINDNQHTVIRPVKPNTKFIGRIRFENLTDIELGALLFVLDLPEPCRHKLGMGKPLGLGSVKITSQLVLTDRQFRYRKLFDGNSWALPEKNGKANDIIADFESFMLGAIPYSERENAQSLWEIPRLRMLKTMLDWNNTTKFGWNEKTRYMEIERGKTATPRGENEYKNRPVLPSPQDI